MAINYTSLLGLAKPVTGTEAGFWGDVVNDQITTLVEAAVAGAVTLDVTSGNVTLTTTVGAANQARAALLLVTGTPGASRNIVAPSSSKVYVVVNGSNEAVVVKGSATTGVTIAAGEQALVAWNGLDFVAIGVTLSGAQTLTNKTINGANNTLTVRLANDVTGDLPFSNLTQGSALSVLGVTGNATADVASIAAGTDNQVLRRSGTSLAFGAVALNQSDAVTGTLPVANGGTGAATLTANNVLLGNGTSALQVVAPGTSGNVLTSNGTTWTSAVIPSQITRATEQSTSSGTEKDFTGIPAGVKRIAVIFNGVSLDSSDQLLVQIGDAVQFETTGYISNSVSNTSTAGFVVRLNSSARAAYGIMTIVNITGNVWVSSHAVGNTAEGVSGGGVVTLSGTLTRLKLTRTAGNFDAGQVNIFYE